MKKMNKIHVFLLFFIAIAVEADFSKFDWEYKKKITPTDIGGIAEVRVDAEVYNRSKGDLSDLRVVSGEMEEIPYKIKMMESETEIVYFEPKLYNLSNIPGKYTEFYLDMDKKNQIINKLHIETPDKNFRRKVEIWGSDDGINWFKIRGDANIFSFYTEDYRTSLTDIKFPDAKRRFYKIVIRNGEEKPLIINRCLVYDEQIYKATLDDIPFKILLREENKDKNRTEIVLDVIYDNIPKKELNLKFASDGYYRSVWVFGSDDSEDWQRIGSGIIYRYNKEDRNNLIDLERSKNRYLKLIIYNQDDSPLKIDDISIKSTRRIIYFPVEKNEIYYLFYGNPDARSPIYEFEKILPFMESEKRVLLNLGKENLNEDFSRVKEVLVKEEPFLIWIMIVFVVLALGYLIVKSLKGINEKRRKQKKREEWKKRYEKQKSERLQKRKFR
jgi:hypothetical protein